ncbi:MAG: TonB-dependent receptor [Vicinamibacterales bacterium]
MRSLLRLGLSLALAAVLVPAIAAAQTVTVSGSVQDSSGGVLSGVAIDATVAGLSVATAVTDPDGRYSIALAANTQHQLRARLDGFADETFDIRPASASMSHDFTLRIAAVADHVVVTATRVPESRSATTESMAVFTAQDIQALGSTSLVDVLRMVPGLNVESTGREGALASLFARGGESDYNLVLLDGVRVNPSGGAYDFSRVSASEIDRLEVVRGGQSSLYGSDAIGSVVQVFTKHATPGEAPRVIGSLEGGSFDTWRGDAGVLGGARRRVDYQLGVAYRGTEGAFQDILPDHDTFNQTSIDASVGAILGDRAVLRSGARYATAKGKAIGPIDYGSRDTGTAADTRDLSWHLDFSHRLSDRVNQSANLNFFRSYRLSADTIADPIYRVYAILAGTPGAIFPDSPRLVRLLDQPTFAAYQSGSRSLGTGQFLATTPFGVSDFTSTTRTEFRRPAFRYQADVTWSPDQLLSGGYDFERETDPLNPSFLVENHAWFVQQQFRARDRWLATVGVRLDHNSRYGNNASPKLSLGGFLLPYRQAALSSLKVFSNIGRGIKNPQFSELYSTAFTDGNPALRPERARTIDAGAEMTFANQRVLGRVTYFDNRFNDQVAFKSTGPGLDGKPDYVNIDGSKANGWELEGALQRPVAGFTASAGYALVDTEVVAFVSTSEQFQPGQPLLRRPKHSSMLRVSYARGRATVNFNLRYVGQRHDAAFLGLSAVASPQFPTGRAVDITVNPAYTVSWLGGEVRLTHDVAAYLRIDNLADTAYESVLGYPGLPRSVTAGLRFNLGMRR